MNTSSLITAHLNPNYLKSVKSRYTKASLFLFFYIWTISTFYDFSGNNHNNFSLMVELINAGFLLIIWALHLHILFNKLNSSIKGYQLTFGGNLISKTTKKHDEINFPFEMVAFVLKSYRSSYTLCDVNGKAILFIPYSIDEINTLDIFLQEKFTVISGYDKFYRGFAFVIPYVFLGLIFTICALKNQLIIALLSVILILLVVLLFSNYYSKIRQQGIKLKSKFFIAPAICILAVLIVLIKKLIE